MEMNMNVTRKAVVSSLAMMVGLGFASGTVWAQDAQGNVQPKGKSKIETQHKTKGATGAQEQTEGQMKMQGHANGGAKADDDTRMKGETGHRANAENNNHMKGEGQNAQTNSGAQPDQNNKHMKTGEAGSSGKRHGSQAEMKSGTGTSGNASDRSMKNHQMKTGEAPGTSNEKTGSVQKNGGTTVNVTSEQRTEIRQVVKTENVEPVEHVTFDVDVGSSIPHSVHLHRLSPRVVSIVPEYRDYEYFVLADGRIVIVDPNTYEIVTILS
jgi:hypothetical protein